MMKLMKKIDNVIAWILKTISITLMISLGMLLMLRVVIRYVPLGNVIPLFASMGWSDEIVEIMMAWMVFCTSTLIMRARDHFRVTVLDDKLKGKVSRNVLNAIISVFGIIFFYALSIYSYKLVKGAEWTTPMLKISQKVPYMSILINSCLMLIYQIRDLVCSIIKIRHRDLC